HYRTLARRGLPSRGDLADVGGFLLAIPGAPRLCPDAAGRRVTTAAAAGPRLVVEDPAARVVGADPDPVVVAVADLADDRLGDPGPEGVERVADIAAASPD